MAKDVLEEHRTVRYARIDRGRGWSVGTPVQVGWVVLAMDEWDLRWGMGSRVLLDEREERLEVTCPWEDQAPLGNRHPPWMCVAVDESGDDCASSEIEDLGLRPDQPAPRRGLIPDDVDDGLALDRDAACPGLRSIFGVDRRVRQDRVGIGRPLRFPIGFGPREKRSFVDMNPPPQVVRHASVRGDPATCSP
jgi:hypothetical protein